MIKKIDFKKGAGTVLSYLAVMWMVTLAIIFFMENFNAFSKVGKTQIYADLISDGSCFIGDNGWGLSQKNAKSAKNKLVSKNKSYFEDIKIPSTGRDEAGNKYFEFMVTDENGKETKSRRYRDNGGDSYNKNTVYVTAKVETDTLTTGQKITAERTASTKITYSGGLRIVREAWKRSYEYKNSTSGQTPYLWGGGHGDNSLSCLDTGADCSGFTTAIFRKCGYASIVGNGCTWDLESCGRTVGEGYGALEYARPGDIILYWYSGSAPGGSDHVAIYAGKHNGVHYQVHSSGGSSTTVPTKTGGMYGKGAHLRPVNMSASHIKIQRIVNAKGKGEKVQETTVGSLSRNQSIIYEALKTAGYSRNAIKGILGNWSYEGNCSPIVREDHSDPNDSYNTSYAEAINKGRIGITTFVEQKRANGRPEGYGIAQWTTTTKDAYHDRKAKLWRAAEKRGEKVTNLYVQISYAIEEMKSSDYNLTPARMNSLSVDEACSVFFQYFEAGGKYDVDGTLKNRQKIANELNIP